MKTRKKVLRCILALILIAGIVCAGLFIHNENKIKQNSVYCGDKLRQELGEYLENVNMPNATKLDGAYIYTGSVTSEGVNYNFSCKVYSKDNIDLDLEPVYPEEAGEKGSLEARSEINDTETLNQVSLLQGLTLGDYYGSKSIKEVKELGNIGLGTFDGLNGELIMLNGVIYRANDKLSIEVPSDDELIPFANVTFFDNDLSYELKDIKTIDELKAELDKKVEELGNNRIYVISIDGKFNSMHIRSERKQTEPYKPLVDVLRVDQTEKNLDNVEGTVVALYTPDYMGDLNAAGWHFHFITSDKQTGGHVLNLDLENGTIIWDFTDNFKLHLPDGNLFKSLDLTVNQDDDIKEVEQGK